MLRYLGSSWENIGGEAGISVNQLSLLAKMLPVIFLWTQGKSDKQRTISFPFEDTVKAVPGILETDKTHHM